MNTPTTSAPPRVAARPTSDLMRGIVTVLLVNAVPIVGVLRYGWSATNVIVLYWFENLLVAASTCLRLLAHRQWTRKRGYWRTGQIGGIEVNGKPVHAGLIGEYAMSSFLFTLAHGVFVGVIVLILAQNYPDQPMWQVSLAQVERGVAAITAMLGIELLADLPTIRARSFAEMKAFAQARMSRILVLHLAIIFGMLAMAVAHSPFGVLYVLIGLKTIADVGGVFARSRPSAVDPAQPPAWMLAAADRVARDKGGAAGLVKKLEQDAERERRNAIEDEETMPAG